jgi:hypothetical protein
MRRMLLGVSIAVESTSAPLAVGQELRIRSRLRGITPGSSTC